MTYADKIRKMSDKELAYWIAEREAKATLYGCSSREAILELMKSEIKEKKAK